MTKTNYWRYENGQFKVLPFIKNFLKSAANRYFFNLLGLSVVRRDAYRLEQISYPKDQELLKIRNKKLSDAIYSHFRDFGVNLSKQDLEKDILRFDQIFSNSEVQNLNGGMGFNNGLILFCLASWCKPNKILESGVWRGFTTYIMNEATQLNCELLCYDINLGNLKYKVKNARYVEADISSDPSLDTEVIDFAFFDDHVSHFDRITFCIDKNIPVIVLDDDVGVCQLHTDGWPPIPTASMIYEYSNIPKRFSWVTHKKNASADIDGIDVTTIVGSYDYIPFPKVEYITGYKDTSFTSLLLKKDLVQGLENDN